MLVASKVMSAFAQDVGFANIPQRLRAEPDRSGLRTFHFNDAAWGTDLESFLESEHCCNIIPQLSSLPETS